MKENLGYIICWLCILIFGALKGSWNYIDFQQRNIVKGKRYSLKISKRCESIGECDVFHENKSSSAGVFTVNGTRFIELPSNF